MKKRGFTLMEILIAVSIIAILSVIGVTSFSRLNKRARDAKRKGDIEQVRSALEMYRADNGHYPNPGIASGFIQLSGEDLGLVSTYMPSTPEDPTSTTQTPVPYYYSPNGSGPPFYTYCICALVESDTGKNDCGATPIASCNYYVRNP